MSANTGAEMAIQMPTFTLASLLTKLMKDAGLTQQELAAKAEVHVGTVGKILRGETRDPEMATLSKIAGALGKTPLDLDLMLDTYNNASAGRIVQMPPQPPPAPPESGDRRKREFSDRARDFAKRYDTLTRAQRLALDAVLSSFEEGNDEPTND
jgi:transcriptional regulator with XRE-family HTH domain